jgi:hypothetical protein
MFMQDATSFRPAEPACFAFGGPATRPSIGRVGMSAASLVETPQGWRQAGTLMLGSLVQTYDGGFCPVARLQRQVLTPAAGGALMHVPGGVLDCCSDMWLMPDQRVMIADRVVEDVLDQSAVLVLARDLAGFRGITLRPLCQSVAVVSLGFAAEEAVVANSGALIHCAAAQGTEPEHFETLDRARAQAMLGLIEGGAHFSDQICRAA